MRILAGDIGGTHARLAIAEWTDGTVSIVHEQRYPSREYPGLAPVVTAFLATAGPRPERACFAVAGPIVAGEWRATNLPWVVRTTDLAAAIGIPHTALINDFAAVGYGVPAMGAADLVTLQAGTPQPHGPIALIGPGTGLGQAHVVWEGAAYRVLPSEGGHTDFAPRSEVEYEMASYLRREFGRVSWERVLSGPGLVNVYRFLVWSGRAVEQAAVREDMTREDPAGVVTRHALAGSDAACGAALDLFSSCLGALAGNVALAILATGGVYLAGGIVPRIAARLAGDPFRAALLDKGRLSALVAGCPVHVIMNPDVGLIGAATLAARTEGA